MFDAMSEERFATSLAFIPWNYRRTSAQVTELLSSRLVPFSVCIHGCDHTRGEFASHSPASLAGKCRKALSRMRCHSERSGLPFDDVMVFPQGLFSTQALESLDLCGYLAAVNTDVAPVNASDGIRLRDLLEPAVTRFGGVPVFGRHYPKDVAEFALELFLGKPALIVEHHTYFRSGYDELRDFMRKMNEVDPELEWTNLASICSRACLQRETPEGEVEVHFYTRRFEVINKGKSPRKYVLSRCFDAAKQKPEVRVNGQAHGYEWECDRLTIALNLEPGEKAEIDILTGRPAQEMSQKWAPGNAYQAKVLMRRVLSEFRDDHIETNRVLSGVLSRVRRLRAGMRKSAGSASAARQRVPVPRALKTSL